MTAEYAASGRDLAEQAREELRPVEQAILSHRFLVGLAAGAVSRDRLRQLAGEQHATILSDRRSFAYLASRFPEAPAGDLFLGFSQGEGEALDRLVGFAARVELERDALAAYETTPAGQTYAAFVAWLALNGSRSDVALALLVNLAAWGANCARVANALREAYGFDDQGVAFFDFFATPSPEFEQHCLKVLDQGLDAGDSPQAARRAARLLQAAELRFWDSLT